MCSTKQKLAIVQYLVAYIVNDESFALQSIELKYLVTGHTFISADSDHASIEKSLRKRKVVYDLDDFCESVRETGITVKCMTHSDFREWTDDVSRNQLQKLGEQRPYLKHVSAFKVVQGSKNFFFKNDSAEKSFQQFNLLKRNSADAMTIPTPKPRPRGIAKQKKEKLNASLLPLIPIQRRGYWRNLPESERSRDLLQSRDKDNTVY